MPKEVELEVANGGFVDTVVEYGWVQNSVEHARSLATILPIAERLLNRNGELSPVLLDRLGSRRRVGEVSRKGGKMT